MLSFGTRLYTWLFGTYVGKDADGNKYYHRRQKHKQREERWVIFREEEEATNIPPEWHAWIHHVTDDIPDKVMPEKKQWQKPHMPNQSGTLRAYRPSGHFLKGSKRDQARGDYEPWHPN